MSSIGNKKIIAKNIKIYMKVNKKTRRDVCADLNIPYSTFTDWINGNIYPRIDKIELLANYFKIEKSDLIEEKSSEYAVYKNSALEDTWREEIGGFDFNEDELKELINFAKFIKSKRGENK